MAVDLPGSLHPEAVASALGIPQRGDQVTQAGEGEEHGVALLALALRDLHIHPVVVTLDIHKQVLAIDGSNITNMTLLKENKRILPWGPLE
jgi:hypothetical protein